MPFCNQCGRAIGDGRTLCDTHSLGASGPDSRVQHGNIGAANYSASSGAQSYSASSDAHSYSAASKPAASSSSYNAGAVAHAASTVYNASQSSSAAPAAAAVRQPLEQSAPQPGAERESAFRFDGAEVDCSCACVPVLCAVLTVVGIILLVATIGNRAWVRVGFNVKAGPLGGCIEERGYYSTECSDPFDVESNSVRSALKAARALAIVSLISAVATLFLVIRTVSVMCKKSGGVVGAVSRGCTRAATVLLCVLTACFVIGAGAAMMSAANRAMLEYNLGSWELLEPGYVWMVSAIFFLVPALAICCHGMCGSNPLTPSLPSIF